MPWSSSSIARSAMTISMSRVIRSSTEQAVGRDRLGVAPSSAPSARGSSPGRPGSGPRGDRRSARRRRRVAVVGLSARISSQKRSASASTGEVEVVGLESREDPPGWARGRAVDGCGRVATGVPRAARGAAVRLLAEQRHLLAAALDERVEPEVRLQVVEPTAPRGRGTPGGGSTSGCASCRARSPRGASGDRSSLWRTSSVRSGATTRNRTVAVLLRDPGVARAGAARRASPSTRPRTGTRRVPRTYQTQSTSATSSTRPADVGEVRPLLALVEPVAEAPGAQPAGLLAAPDPDAHPEAVAAVGEAGRSSRRARWARPQEVVAGHDPVGRAGPAAVALEAGPDERLVGQVVAGEQARRSARGTTTPTAGRRSTGG